MARKTENYHLRIPSETANLQVIRNFVSDVAKSVGFENQDIGKIELAVDEACTNVIEHAYHQDSKKDIDVAVKIDFDKFTVVITDHGKGFKPEDVDIPDMNRYLAELRVGGLGIYLMKHLMDEVEYRTQPGVSNEVRMVKYLIRKDNKKKQSA
ncbi:ATP-binding protein [bacterium]|nr:ATP-binding protein [bacterium]